MTSGLSWPRNSSKLFSVPDARRDMIHFDQVSKRYAESGEVLCNLSLEIAAGEMVFLTGHSGAGKSTLLKLIGCLERPSRGQLMVDGRNVGRLPRHKIPFHRRQVGMIFQDHRLLTDRPVFDNVALPLVVAGLGHQEVGRRVRAALNQVGLLKKEKSLPLALSGGEQQRVGIARAIVARPPLLLADEPTGNLDPGLSREIMGLFARFNKVGVTLLIASHNLDLIASLPYRTLTLEKGAPSRRFPCAQEPSTHLLIGPRRPSAPCGGYRFPLAGCRESGLPIICRGPCPV
jgi:cell division transport system ATP-binding protein